MIRRRKILVVGNHTCGNRGDAAILRGLLETLIDVDPDAEVDVTSRFPISSAYLLGRPVEPDLFYRQTFSRSAVMQRVFQKAMPFLLMLSGPANSPFRSLLPRRAKAQIDLLKRYDAVIQVGGSFFVDLYGAKQFETPFAAILAERPLLLIGHSIGPLGSRSYRRLVRYLLQRARRVTLRERISFDLLKHAGMPLDNVEMGHDTAWSVAPQHKFDRSVKDAYFAGDERPIVAITVRNLKPFDRRLGTTQEAFETAFANVVDRILESGCNVLALSTCTGIEGYHADDRMVALKIGRKVGRPDRYRVVMDELNDLELGDLLGQCALTLGTRLHSAIISLNFGTPALAINYEHKSKGIMAALELDNLSVDVAELLDGRLADRIGDVIADAGGLRDRVSEPVEKERLRVRAMVTSCLESIQITCDSASGDSEESR